MRVVLLLALLLLAPVYAQSGIVVEKKLNKPVARVGEPVTVTLTIKNTGSVELKNVEVRDSVSLPGYNFLYTKFISSLAPGESLPLSYEIYSLAPGNFTLPPARVKYYDPLEKKVQTVESDILIFRVVNTTTNASTSSSGGNSTVSDIIAEKNETKLYYAVKKRGIGVGDVLKFSLIGFLLALPVAYLVYAHSKKKGKEITKKYEEKKLEKKIEPLIEAKKLYYSGNQKDAFEILSREIRTALSKKHSLSHAYTLREMLNLLDKELPREQRETAKKCVEIIERAEFSDKEIPPEDFNLVLHFAKSLVKERRDEAAVSG